MRFVCDENHIGGIIVFVKDSIVSTISSFPVSVEEDFSEMFLLKTYI